MVNKRQLVWQLAQHEADIDDYCLDNFGKIEDLIEVAGRDSPLIRSELVKAIAGTRERSLKRNLGLYTGRGLGLREGLVLRIMLGKEGLEVARFYKSEKCILRGVVLDESAKFLNGSPVSREEFEHAFADAVEKYGPERFVSSEMNYAGINMNLVLRTNEFLSLAKDRNPAKAEEYRDRMNALNVQRTLQMRVSRGFVDYILGVHERYHGDGEGK
jgi:hypothetical protein